MKHSIGREATERYVSSLPERFDPEHIGTLLEQMDRYIDLILKHAEQRQLLAASQRSVGALWLHVFDSLQVLSVTGPGHWNELWDAGSGNGMPGVPLAAAVPAASIRLIDRSAKKADFLQLAVATLGLRSASVSCLELSQMLRGTPVLPTITARALVQPVQWRDVLRSITSPPDWIIFATAANASEWEQIASDYLYDIKSIHTYTLPGTETSRSLLYFTAA